MSDLSKFLPKSYQKDPVEDQMIKPIGSLNISDHNLAQAPQATSNNLNTVNNFEAKPPKKIKTKNPSSKKKTTLLLLLLLFLLVSSGAGLLLMRQRQDTRQEAYGESFCGPGYYGQYCINDPNRTWNGRCVLIYCPLGNEIGPGCSENDREARWEFGPCPELLAKARSNEHIAPGCWQVDAVSDNNVYCNVAGCKSYELDTSNCGNLVPTNTPTPTVPPTTIPPTAVPPTGVPPTTVPPTGVPPTAVPPTAVPPTGVPPTAVPPTDVPPTGVPPTGVPPTDVPPTDVPPTDVPSTNTPTATNTPVSTTKPTTIPTSVPNSPTPIITQVITTVGCNESCNENADCTNISHICYESVCRLDVNPTDVNCRLADGGNVIERAVTVPTESGFAEWFNFLKVGFGILGLGALLLLLL